MSVADYEVKMHALNASLYHLSNHLKPTTDYQYSIFSDKNSLSTLCINQCETKFYL